jgi:CHAT domain-containing protein
MGKRVSWALVGAVVVGLAVSAGAQSRSARCRAPLDPAELSSSVSDAPADELLGAGLAAFRAGDYEDAVARWSAAANKLRAAGDSGREIDARLQLAQGYAALGQVSRALASLERGRELADGLDDPVRSASLLAVLGDTALAIGDVPLAEQQLDAALVRARESDKPALEAAVLNSRGNAYAARGAHAEAATAYETSARLAQAAGEKGLYANASANAVRAHIEADELDDAAGRIVVLEAAVIALSDSSSKARVFVHLGRSREQLGERRPEAAAAQRIAAGKDYDAGRAVAERIGDRRTASYALGYLGALYEREGRGVEAADLTRRALFAAQEGRAPEALYLWQWQLARIRAADLDVEGAIEAYRGAVATLDQLRNEAAVSPAGAGRDFESSVKPVYFGLVDLLLQRAVATEERTARERLLHEARNTVEDLKTEELRDYFEDECLAAQQTAAPDAIPNTLVVYPIVLEDRTELIVSTPEGMRSFVVDVSSEQLNTEVRALRQLLEKRTTREYRPHAATLYDWLIRPVLQASGSAAIDTFVFVPDGSLRTIPVAALYDRETKQFLVQQLPVAIVPGLTLTDPRRIPRKGLRLLVAALTEAVQGFPALPYVAGEVEAIRGVFGGETLMNEQFVESAVEDELRKSRFGIVHIASHGEFTANSRDSFLLTYDGKLPMDRLAGLVSLTQYGDEPIELLSLSACETAAGDERAALGLAGVAVRSGARSALATLWAVNDQASADLVAEFYRQLQDESVSRAQALQRAQLSLIETRRYRHPGYWAPFLLINNWL